MEVKEFRCQGRIYDVKRAGMARCNAKLAEIEPLHSTVIVKCWRCGYLNAYSPVSLGLLVGGRVLTFGTAII